MYLPVLPKTAVHPMPDGVNLPGSPADMRIYKNNEWPVNIGPSNPVGAEILWRLFVAARQARTWVAVEYAAIMGAALMEYERAKPEKQLYVGHLYPAMSDEFEMQLAVERFGMALRDLVRSGYITLSGDLIWLLPHALEDCRVPEGWSDDLLLK